MIIEKLQLIAEHAVFEPVYPNEAFPPSVYYRFLKLLAKEMKPNLQVELGVCGGGGSLHMALGHPKGQVIGVDFAWDHPENIGIVESVCPNFKFHLGDSVSSSSEIFNQYGPVDILFVDTDHTEGSTTREWNSWKPCLSPGAVVCFDDLFRPGMEEFWDTVEEPKVRLDFLHDGTYPHGGGFGVVAL